MSVLINASTSTGLVQSADTSGEIELQSNGTTALKVNTNEGIQILNCLGVGNATPSTSGAGITFPATQSASSDANTLDDYEEGTFTPTLTATTTNPSVTYVTQLGAYTKIGNVVSVFCRLQTSAVSGGSGNSQISGLPFTASATYRNGAGVAYVSNVDLGAGFTQFGFDSDGNTNIRFIQTGDNAGASLISIGSIGAGLDVVFSFTYRV